MSFGKPSHLDPWPLAIGITSELLAVFGIYA